MLCGGSNIRRLRAHQTCCAWTMRRLCADYAQAQAGPQPWFELSSLWLQYQSMDLLQIVLQNAVVSINACVISSFVARAHLLHSCRKEFFIAVSQGDSADQ